MKSDSREIEIMESKHVLVNTGLGNRTQVETGIRYYDPMNGKSLFFSLACIFRLCKEKVYEMVLLVYEMGGATSN